MFSEILKQKILDLEKKAKDAGFTFVSEDIGDDAILLVNQKSHKAAIIGSFKSDGREVLVSYLVNLKKWSWAEQEGFSKDDIINTPELKNNIFEFVPVSQIMGKLI
jgi:hypothetical protein